MAKKERKEKHLSTRSYPQNATICLNEKKSLSPSQILVLQWATEIKKIRAIMFFFLKWGILKLKNKKKDIHINNGKVLWQKAVYDK